MDIINIEFVQELVEACNYFWEAGWGECHAGNISYLLDEKEIEQVKDFLKSTSILTRKDLKESISC